MKLQINEVVVASVAANCTPTAGTLEVDVARVMNSLALQGYNPVTRKDITAVLLKMGSVRDPLTHDEWCELGACISQHGSPLKERKGYYSVNAVGTVLRPIATVESTVAEIKATPVVKNLGENLTEKWFESQVRDNALDRKVAALLRRKYPQESPEDLLSEVHLWFCTWSHQRTCDAYIADGKPPTIAILTIWLEGKIVHRLYREGQDALVRHVKGVRTQGEVSKRNELGASDYMVPEAVRADNDAPRAVWVGEKDDENGLKRDFVAFAEEVAELGPEERGLVRDVVRVRRRRAAERYARIFDHMVEGRTKEEAAAIEGCSTLRVTHLFQRVRDDLREAPLLLEVALKVLQTVEAEPFSSRDEIEETIDADAQTELEQAIELLVLRGLVTQGHGNCFAPTDAGRAAVESDSLI